MRITNTSRLPDAVVRTLVRFAAREREVSSYVRKVHVRDARKRECFRGRCWGVRVEVHVGADRHYPTSNRTDLANAPSVQLADAIEGFVLVLGHEMQHSRQFMVERQTSTYVRKSEVDAERFGVAVLAAFRERREEILGGAAEVQARRDELRQVRAAAEPSPDVAKVARLQAKVAEWRTREKRAATWRKKWERKLRRAMNNQPKGD